MEYVKLLKASILISYLHISNLSLMHHYLDISKSQGTIRSSRQFLFYKHPQAAYAKYHFNAT